MFNPEIEIINVKVIGDHRLTVCQACKQYQADQTCRVSEQPVAVYELESKCPEEKW